MRRAGRREGRWAGAPVEEGGGGRPDRAGGGALRSSDATPLPLAAASLTRSHSVPSNLAAQGGGGRGEGGADARAAELECTLFVGDLPSGLPLAEFRAVFETYSRVGGGPVLLGPAASSFPHPRP